MKSENTAIYESQSDEQERRTCANAEEIGRVRHYHQEGDGGASGKAKTGVYYAWHAETGSIYIGSSLDTSKRVKRHISDSKNGRMNFFARKLRELGVESFTWGVIELCEKSDRLAREERWIEAFNATGRNGFNTRKHPTKGWSYEIDESTRRRMSESRLGKKQSDETCAKKRGRKQVSGQLKRMNEARRGTKLPEAQRLARIGKKRSPESCARISAAQIGRKATDETRKKLRAAHLGKKLTPEHRKNVGDAIRGLKRTPETIAKMRAAHLGKTHSLETREKISRVQIGRVVSAHTRAKIGAFRKGKRHSEEAKAKIRAAHLGKTLSDEHRAKLSLLLLGKKQSAETCQKRLKTWAMKRKQSAE